MVWTITFTKQEQVMLSQYNCAYGIMYKTIRQFSKESGYTEAAIRDKIQKGIWLEDRVFKRAPDGRILISVNGFYEWVENGNGLNCHPSKGIKKPTAKKLK